MHKALCGFVVVASLIGVFSLMPVTAWSADCNATVDDGAGIFTDDITKVEAAAQDLVRAGADVRVITMKSWGNVGNLDQWKEHTLQRCASWQSGDGGMKNNLIVLVIALSERQSGLYYGDLYERKLHDAWNPIRAEMGSYFRSGNFADGFAYGLKEIHKAIEASPSARSEPPVRVIMPERQPSAPADLSGLWRVLGWGVGLLAVGFAIVFGFRFLEKERAHRERRRAAQQQARLAKTSCATSIGELREPVELLGIKQKRLAQLATAEELEPLQATLNRFNGLWDNALIEFTNLGQSANDPDRDNLTESEYRQIAGSYEKLLDKLNALQTARKNVDAEFEELATIAATMPETIARTASALTVAAKDIDAVVAQGFKTAAATAAIELASATLTEAKDAATQKRMRMALGLCRQALEQTQEASASATNLMALRNALNQGLDALRKRMAETLALIAAGRTQFEAISSTYAESSWKPIRGNGTEAENRLSWCEKAIAAATRSASMKQQDWQNGLDLVTQVNAWLDEAGSFMRSIKTLGENLEAAQQNAAKEIEAAAHDIVAAQQFIAQHDDDIREELEKDLAQAERLVDEARAELAKAKPDYLRTVKLAAQANTAADTILVEARTEHETAERLRQRAQSSLREAKRSVDTAREYLEDHGADAGQSAKALLHDAQQHLAAAQSAGSLEEQVRFAESADQKAASALSKAQSDVEEKEDRRRRARARRAATSSASSSGWGSSSSGSFGSSSGHGGSGGWGGSSSGFGGSGSFGSSSHGGGGSGGW